MVEGLIGVYFCVTADGEWFVDVCGSFNLARVMSLLGRSLWYVFVVQRDFSVLFSVGALDLTICRCLVLRSILLQTDRNLHRIDLIFKL